MKSLYTLLASLVLFSAPVLAQNYHATYEVGKSWQTSALKLPSSPIPSSNDSVYCDSDTVIMGQSYIRLVSANWDQYDLLFREDLTSGEVFFYNLTDSAEYPIMDLSAQVGDTLVSFIPWTKATSLSNGDDSLIYIVDKYKVQDMLGDSLVVLEYEVCASLSFYGPYFYVEKFGSFESPLYARYPCNLNHVAQGTSHCGYENGVQFFMNWQTDSCGISTVSVNEMQPDIFKIYPNPAHSTVRVEGEMKGEVVLLSLNGRVLGSWVKAESELVLDLSQFSRGVYLIRFESDNRQLTKRLMVE
ncbi:MAG: T9SS type A sorting domain-containing protein [Flavobacteriia bacterium]|nr:T9SS type A sorting domain-containing protein [Flavobacteriia bacterium]